jgi:uncharacterized protein (TIGR00251 family)
MSNGNKKEPLVLTVHVVPRASRTEIVGEHDGALRVRIAAPPVEGAANEELIRLLAKTYAVAKRNVTVVSGERSRIKRVRIEWR